MGVRRRRWRVSRIRRVAVFGARGVSFGGLRGMGMGAYVCWWVGGRLFLVGLLLGFSCGLL